MFEKILIANRGEIACRIIRTCRRLGIETVAVHSSADNCAMHVRMADETVEIGPAPAVDSYLCIDRIIDAARRTGAQAIHPGYGFLAENSAFAEACETAGLTFIGPTAATITAMGSKSVAKDLMQKAGVPVIPGFRGSQEDAELEAGALATGYPVLIKASAGGGGKGMRIVEHPNDFPHALAAARRESRSAFGDDEVIIEKFIDDPRHIEVQIFGDNHGNIVHLFERECSMQRRYQKVIEEAPAPRISDRLRAALHDAAIAAGHAVEYRNAGTVEFIVAPDESFYFMEMNTRLQVEHPVTELITGLDLVEWQLQVAAGGPLPLQQDQIPCTGNAIEARIYAERPEQNFMPATGSVTLFTSPADQHGVRVDTGYEAGDAITPWYDPLLAKLCVHGESRESAIKRFSSALNHTALFGVGNNLAFLRKLSKDEKFIHAQVDTNYLDRQLDDILLDTDVPADALLLAAIAASQAAGQPQAQTPWTRGDSWRIQRDLGARVVLRRKATEWKFQVRGHDGRFRVAHDETWHTAETLPGERFETELRLDGAKAIPAHVYAGARRVQVVIDQQAFEFEIPDPYTWEPGRSEEDTHPTAPMPGRIVAVAVRPGDSVAKGQLLVSLEGMKMEFALRAATAGTVKHVHVAEGDFVEADAVLVDLE
jgi:3-methylcrotonyl-CoA carboxylase alpha subunit